MGLRRLASSVYRLALTNWYMQYRRYFKFKQRRAVEQELAYWRAQESKVLQVGEKGYRLKVQELGLSPEHLARLDKEQARGPVVLGDIDKNGLLLSYFGPIASVPTVAMDQYVERRRFRVQLVARDGYVGVRKSYADRKVNFVNELKILHHLGEAGCRVPAIMAVEFDDLSLTISFIAGRVLKEELAARGAKLYSSIPGKPEGPKPDERRRARATRADEGRRRLAEVVDKPFVEMLYQELCSIHAAGVMDIDIKYGNVIIEARTQQPYWIDFEHATFYGDLDRGAFEILRRRDINKFALFFGADGQVHAPGSNPDAKGLHEARTLNV